METEEKSLQWLQAGATLLARNWEAVAEGVGGGLADLATRCEARPSAIDGVGLFAARDLRVGELAALYRADFTVDAAGHGFAVEDADYFREAVVPGRAAGTMRQHWVYPPGLVTSAAPDGATERFHVAANPRLPPVAGWLAHLANDGDMCTGTDDDEVLRYLNASGERRNAVFVPLAAPLMGLMMTEDARAGDEVLVSYGHANWLDKPLAADQRADVAAVLQKDAAEYVALTLMAARSYGREIAALAHFVRTGTIVADPPAPDARTKRKTKKKTGKGFAR